jgi:hypothetical protein
MSDELQSTTPSRLGKHLLLTTSTDVSTTAKGTLHSTLTRALSRAAALHRAQMRRTWRALAAELAQVRAGVTRSIGIELCHWPGLRPAAAFATSLKALRMPIRTERILCASILLRVADATFDRHREQTCHMGMGFAPSSSSKLDADHVILDTSRCSSTSLTDVVAAALQGEVCTDL